MSVVIGAITKTVSAYADINRKDGLKMFTSKWWRTIFLILLAIFIIVMIRNYILVGKILPRKESNASLSLDINSSVYVGVDVAIIAICFKTIICPPRKKGRSEIAYTSMEIKIIRAISVAALLLAIFNLVYHFS